MRALTAFNKLGDQQNRWSLACPAPAGSGHLREPPHVQLIPAGTGEDVEQRAPAHDIAAVECPSIWEHQHPLLEILDRRLPQPPQRAAERVWAVPAEEQDALSVGREGPGAGDARLPRPDPAIWSDTDQREVAVVVRPCRVGGHDVSERSRVPMCPSRTNGVHYT
jgi:hypothetical protein